MLLGPLDYLIPHGNSVGINYLAVATDLVCDVVSDHNADISIGKSALICAPIVGELNSVTVYHRVSLCRRGKE